MQNGATRRSAVRWLPIIVAVGATYGCATSLTEQEQFEQEYARVERKESIRLYVAECERKGNTIVYTGPTYQKLRDPAKHIPWHARPADYQCVTHNAINREFGTGSY